MSTALVVRLSRRAGVPRAWRATSFARPVQRAVVGDAGAAVCSSRRAQIAAVAAGCCVVSAGGWSAVLCEEPAAEQERQVRTGGQIGEWRQDWTNSESLGPFLRGLGVPGFAVRLVDAIKTDLSISCDGNVLVVVDKTLFGKNTTEVVLGAEEVERATRTGRKKFMLSGFEDAEGWLTVQCRLFQRGPGWLSQQSWKVREDGVLEERMLLKRPGEEDVVVRRLFNPLGGRAKAKEQPFAGPAAGAAPEAAEAAQDCARKGRPTVRLGPAAGAPCPRPRARPSRAFGAALAEVARPLALVGGGLALVAVAAGLYLRGRPSREK